MKHVIIGTAGHVDHGKTVLIRALTGIDTDRLEEEKRRGITIELGFAHLDYPDGTQAGIVDVPGHEKFIRNMLAGAGGIDLAMLVVAADEGFMPQTVEHLNILTLLGIRDGLTVITKKDAVEEEWLELMQEEVRERLKGTFLETKPVLCVSAKNGDGIPELKEALHTLILRAGEKSSRIPFRLPADRVFSVDGFGTVVTGTLIEGCMQEGESAMLYPGGRETRIRSLQVHGKSVQTAYAGQRVAVNLGGLRKEDVSRGDIVARPGTMRVSMMLDVKLTHLKDSRRLIENDMQVHLYLGASVVLAKVVLLDTDVLKPGESGYAQLRMKETVAAKNGDRFVIRFYSPLETIGGGVILDDAPLKHKRRIPGVIEALKIKESGREDVRFLQTLAEYKTALPDLGTLALKLGLTEEETERLAAEAVSCGRAAEPLPGRYIAGAVLEQTAEKCEAVLAAYHRLNPLHAGMKAAELRQKAFTENDRVKTDAFLQELEHEGRIRRTGERYALSAFEVKYTKRQTAIKKRLLEIYGQAGIEPASLEEVTALFSMQERNDLKQVVDSLLSGGDLVMLSAQIVYSRDAYETAAGAVKKHFETAETITLAELRDALGTSRKYALAFLEYLDKNGVTKKEGDFRRLRNGFPGN